MPVKKNLGFSLLEVLIFVSIIGLFFIAAASIATISLRAIQSNKNKILATRYAEELAEWIRGEKEADWQEFTTGITNKVNKTYCFYTSPIQIWPSQGACNGTSEQKIRGIFEREISLSLSGERVNVNIVVEWLEGNQTLSVPIKTVFEKFE